MKKNHFKVYMVITIFILIIGISIAYATLSQTLKVNSTTTIQSSKTSWNIKITEVSCRDYGYATHGTVQHTDTTVTISNINLKSTADWIRCWIDIKNEGEVDAKLSSYTRIGPTITGTGNTAEKDKENFLSNFWGPLAIYDTQYPNGRNIDMNSSDDTSLKSGVTKQFVIGFGYNNDTGVLPTNELTISEFGYTMNYVQAS